MELWWRGVALQALRAYMTSMLGTGLAADAADAQVSFRLNVLGLAGEELPVRR